MSRPQPRPQPDFLAEGGALGRLMRAHPWDRSPLGGPEAWPANLRTLVRVMLGSRQPMFIAWGPERTMLYNDGYAPLCGSRHPWALGRPFAEVWADVLDRIGPVMDAAYRGEPTYTADVQLTMLRNGYPEEAHFAFGYTPVRNEATGAVEGMVCTCLEISAEVLAARLREAETELLRRSSEQTELALSAGAGVGTWDWHVPTNVMKGDERFARLCGVEPQVALDGAAPKAFFQGVPEGDRTRVLAQVDAVLRAGGVFAAEYRVRRPDGNTVWLLSRGNCRLGPDGAPQRFSGVCVDITQRKSTEEALREAKDERDFIIRLTAGQRTATSPDEVMRRTAELLGRRLGVSRAGFYRMADGETLEFGPGWSDGVLPLRTGRMAIAALGGAYVETLKAGEPFAFGDVQADPGIDAHTVGQRGTRAGINVPLVRAGRWEAGFYVSGTEPRVWSAGAVALAEEVAQLSWDAVERARAERLNLRRSALLDLDDRLRDLTDTADVAFAAGETLGRTLGVARAGYGSVDASAETIVIERDWREKGVLSLAGLLNLRAHGSYIDDLKRGETVVVPDVRDDRRTAGTAAALEAMDMRSFVDMPIIENGALVALLYLDHTIPRLFPADELAFMREVGERTRAAVERRRAERRLEALNQLLEERVAERSAALLKAEEQLRQMQKMEAVGQLTGGIAHDFNNMMAVVIGGLNLLQRRLARGDTDVGRFIDGAMDGANRAAALTQRLLAFARQQSLAPEPVDANAMIAGMLDLVTRSLGEQVRVETALAPGLWRAKVDPGQLENALLNLSVNSRDAMPNGGTLTLGTANADLGEAEGAAYGVPAGAYVTLSVSDTGVGMSAEVIDKAFDPFFTTKGVGKGTGLGLSQVFGFINQSGGQVRIDSAVGVGTTVRIFLPRFTGEAAPLPRERPASAERGQAGEIVMVVEDEERVRAFSAEALRELGYTVVETRSARDALQQIEEGREVSLLFTDIVMPDLTGPQLADLAVKRRPGLKVLYTTGYARNALPHDGLLDASVNFLAKPFGIEQLAAKVRGALDKD